MTAERHGRRVELVEDGRVVAAADLEPVEDPATIRTSLHATAGHTPVGAQARLVEAVLDLDEAGHSSKLEVTIPIGDFEALEQIRERCDDVQTRAAGATCLVDAKLPGTRPADTKPAEGGPAPD